MREYFKSDKKKREELKKKKKEEKRIKRLNAKSLNGPPDSLPESAPSAPIE